MVQTGSKAYQAVQTGSRPIRQYKLGPGLPGSTNWVKDLPVRWSLYHETLYNYVSSFHVVDLGMFNYFILFSS